VCGAREVDSEYRGHSIRVFAPGPGAAWKDIRRCGRTGVARDGARGCLWTVAGLHVLLGHAPRAELSCRLVAPLRAGSRSTQLGQVTPGW